MCKKMQKNEHHNPRTIFGHEFKKLTENGHSALIGRAPLGMKKKTGCNIVKKILGFFSCTRPWVFCFCIIEVIME